MSRNNQFRDGPWPNQADADAYEEWHRYLEECRRDDIAALEQDAGLSSQNVDPANFNTQDLGATCDNRAEEIKNSYDREKTVTQQTQSEKTVTAGESDHEDNDDRPF